MACANTGVFSMIGSFVLPTALPRLAAAEWFMDVLVEPPGVPSWWQVSADLYQSDNSILAFESSAYQQWIGWRGYLSAHGVCFRLHAHDHLGCAQGALPIEQRRATSPCRGGGHMKRMGIVGIAVTAMVHCLVAAPAHAQSGVNLSWDDCGSAGVFDKSFDCATEQGGFSLYGSFVAPPGIHRLRGYTFEVGTLYLGNLPTSWWDLGAGGCRAGTWSVSAAEPGPGCVPFPGGHPIVIAQAQFDDHGHLRIRGQAAFLEPQDIPGDTEFYAFTLRFRNTRVNTCDGCCDGLCLVLGSISLTLAEEGDIVLEQFYQSGWVSWQGGWCGVRGQNAVSTGSAGCLQTPTRASTWGSIKALYR